jgi:hypothetical protein
LTRGMASQPVSPFRINLGLRPLRARVDRLAMLKNLLRFQSISMGIYPYG